MLVKFDNLRNNATLFVNPAFVVTVGKGRDTGRVEILLSSGGSVVVRGELDEVVKVLDTANRA